MLLLQGGASPDIRDHDARVPLQGPTRTQGSGGRGKGEGDKEYFRALQGFVDDLPPHTVVTHVVRQNNEVLVRGTSFDTSKIRQVTVNGRRAYSTRDNFSEWEVLFGAADNRPFEIKANAEDVLGNIEPRPHTLTAESAR